jgi:HK97 family phage major capsid protein
MRSNILALRQRKADLTKQGKGILAVADREKRELTEGEELTHSRTVRALEQVEKDIIAEESRLAGENVGPMYVDENQAFAAAAMGNPIPDNPHAPRRRTIGRAGRKSWADLFGPPRGNGGFKSIEEFVHAVRVSGEIFDPRLRASMGEDIPSQGGFLVPEHFAEFVLQWALENAIVMPRAQVWPMQSETMKIPGVWDYDHSAGTLFGGLKAIWYDELAPLDEQDIKTRMIQLSAHKLGILSNASSELVEDGPMFESVLVSSMQAAAQFFLDSAFFFGTGSGQPQGMLTSANPALVTVAKDPGTPNYWINLEDVLNMFKAMAPACRMRAEWVFTDELIPALWKMQNVVKNVSGTENVGGSAVPVFVPNDSGGGTLLGRPVTFTEKLKPAGSVGDALFAAFDQYAIGMRREINLRRSLEAGFVNDSIWWRLTVRTDGQSTWSNTLTLQNGNKVSPFVTLAARGGSTTATLGEAGMITTKAIEAPSAPAVVKPHQERRH